MENAVKCAGLLNSSYYTDGQAINSARYSKIQQSCHLIATFADHVGRLYDEAFKICMIIKKKFIKHKTNT